ncbi:MAG TPA: HEAT repeat domain-containing protein [Streptosporangiaceae bacterium]|jgi:HEAT repeat protein
MTPRQSIELECHRRGRPAVVTGCIGLLGGGTADDALVFAIGGPAANSVLGGGQRYWLRVWGARALLYAWEDRAAAAVIAATGDESWRVREMAAKVIARHRVGDALDAVAGLRQDEVPRVRAAAARAVTVLTAHRA